MNYYLRQSKEIFVDSHEDSDDGLIDIDVIKTKVNINTKFEYKEVIDDYDVDFEIDFKDEDDVYEYTWTGNEDLEGSDDGYNMKYLYVKYIKITEADFENYSNIIKSYKKLFKKFK